MYMNKLPAIIALPIMAVVIAFAAQMPPSDIASVVVAGGATRLNVAIITVMFGAILSQFVGMSGIAETLIKKFAELSGDNPILVSIVMTLIVALLFSVLGGLGAVIMVASIVLPILLSIGIPRVVAAGLFLMGMSLGGMFNLVNWQLYISVLGIPQGQIMKFALVLGAVSALVTLLFLLVEMKRQGTSVGWSVTIEDVNRKNVPWYSLLTPIIPIVIVLGFSIYNILCKPLVPYEFPIITAMIIGVLWGYVTTLHKGSLNLLTKAVVEGINSVGPAVALIIGIGMVLNAVMHQSVTSIISPVLVTILPSTPLYYVLFFTILAPLALYRGPLNIWGMGAGMVGLMVASGSLPPAAIMAALMSVGEIQGVCDPTNTHNVWIANYLNINVQSILKLTIAYIWILSIIGLLIASIVYY